MHSLVEDERHRPPLPRASLRLSCGMQPLRPRPCTPTLTPVFPQRLACSCHHRHPSPDVGLALVCYSVNIDPLNGCHFYTVGTGLILFCNLKWGFPVSGTWVELVVLDCIQWKWPEYNVQCASPMTTGTVLWLVPHGLRAWSRSPVSSSIPARCFSARDLSPCSCWAELELVGTLNDSLYHEKLAIFVTCVTEKQLPSKCPQLETVVSGQEQPG